MRKLLIILGLFLFAANVLYFTLSTKNKKEPESPYFLWGDSDKVYLRLKSGTSSDGYSYNDIRLVYLGHVIVKIYDEYPLFNGRTSRSQDELEIKGNLLQIIMKNNKRTVEFIGDKSKVSPIVQSEAMQLAKLQRFLPEYAEEFFTKGEVKNWEDVVIIFPLLKIIQKETHNG